MTTLTTGIVQSYSRATGIATVRTTAGTQEVSADVFASPRFPRAGEAVKCTVDEAGRVVGFRPFTDEETLGVPAPAEVVKAFGEAVQTGLWGVEP